MCQSLFFNKVAGLRPATLLKRDSDRDIFLQVVVYVRLLGQFYTFYFFYDKILQALKSTKSTKRH